MRPRATGPAIVRALGARLALLLGVVLLLGGCVSVPTSGPVEKVEGSQPGCENCVNVEVQPPAPGEDRIAIVKNYLRANANYQPGYSVARQYLTPEAATTWKPDQGVLIYDNQSFRQDKPGMVTLTGEQVGFLDERQAYNARPQRLNLEFPLVFVNGGWRIDNPPAGLVVARNSFEALFKPYDVYFLGDTGSLVPQPVYLPNLRDPDNVASVLVTTLLKGPSRWLGGVARTVAPSDAALAGDAVTIVDGVAQVPLTGSIQKLSAADRTALVAQLVYTLQQVTGVKKVRLLAQDQPVQVTESEPGDLAVPVEDVPAAFDPIPAVSDQLYAVRRGRLAMVSSNADNHDLSQVDGPLGDGTLSVDSLAVSVTNSSLAAVTDGRTVLRQAVPGGTTTTDVTPKGVTELLRPQYSRDDRLWVAGTQRGRQRMWTVTPAASTEVRVPALAGHHLVAFRLSPDGSRIAMLLRSGSTTRLGVARIMRTATRTTVSGWLELQTSATASATPTGTSMRDVAWADANTLLVLWRQGTGGPYVPVRISDDASRAEPEPQSRDWEPRSVEVVLRTKTALLVSADGQVYRDDGTSWQPYLSGVSAVACPG